MQMHSVAGDNMIAEVFPWTEASLLCTSTYWSIMVLKQSISCQNPKGIWTQQCLASPCLPVM